MIPTEYLIKIIYIYVVIQIIAMDIGLPQSNFQTKLLTNKYVIPFVLYACAYEMTKNNNLSITVATLFMIGKFVIPNFIKNN